MQAPDALQCVRDQVSTYKHLLCVWQVSDALRCVRERIRRQAERDKARMQHVQ